MAQLVLDNFNRADSTGLGANWSAGGGHSQLDIVSNQAKAASAGTDRTSAYTGYGAFPNDQWAEITIGVYSASAPVYPKVRCATGSASFYYTFNDSGTTYIAKLVSGSWAPVTSASDSLWITNDVIRLEAEGTTIRVRKNGTIIASATDSSLTSGYPAIGHEASSGNAASIDAFAAGDFSTGNATLTSPTPSGTLSTSTTATLGATTNQGTAGSNNAYAVWGTSNSFSGVTATQVKAGQNASGSSSGVSTSGAVAITSTSISISITSLTPNTTYYYAIVQNNSNGDSNVVTGSFTTAVATSSTSIRLVSDDTTPAANLSISWFITSTWGGSVLASGTTSTDASGHLTLLDLSPAAGSYLLFYKVASDETLTGTTRVSLV